MTIPFGVHSGTGLQRMTMAVLGAGVVLCVGLLGRAVAGPWVGLVAAGLAALAPNFWIPNGILMSETPAMLLMALVLLAVVRLLRSPTWSSAALLGAACGAEILVRAELILFVPTLVLPAALAARPVTVRRRLGLAAVAVLVVLVVLAPWVGRNLATFKDPTYISTGDGLALLGANCPQAYSGQGLGTWHLGCMAFPNADDESVKSSLDQHAAIQFAEHHAGRLPVVVLARIGRLWDFYEPVQMVNIDVNEGRPVPASWAGLVVYYALLPCALAGIVVLRRRGIRQWFLLVPAGVLTVGERALLRIRPVPRALRGLPGGPGRTGVGPGGPMARSHGPAGRPPRTPRRHAPTSRRLLTTDACDRDPGPSPRRLGPSPARRRLVAATAGTACQKPARSGGIRSGREGDDRAEADVADHQLVEGPAAGRGRPGRCRALRPGRWPRNSLPRSPTWSARPSAVSWSASVRCRATNSACWREGRGWDWARTRAPGIRETRL